MARSPLLLTTADTVFSMTFDKKRPNVCSNGAQSTVSEVKRQRVFN